MNNDDKNEFLTRGCKYKPRLYQKNEDIYSHGCCKRNVYDWLDSIVPPPMYEAFDGAEVRFKNSRKDFFRISPGNELLPGDIVAVESSPGHEIGIVTLLGESARLQMKRKGTDPYSKDLKKIYRRARPSDVEKWVAAISHEQNTLNKTRKIIRTLGLEMKLNDVEYQGDSTKATFYYSAEDRVDFRELIRILADEFSIRIEMRQIGVRQEASNLGGLGTCGRELCCSTWLTRFRSVSTNTARVQQLSINPQKLAGQCGKLKCCINYEHECYNDALKAFPPTETVIRTKRGAARCQKIDVFGGIMWYSYEDDPADIMAIPVDKVKKIMNDNSKGVQPAKLEDFAQIKEKKIDFETFD